MKGSIVLCPFAKQGVFTFLYSWLVSLPPSQEKVIKSSDIRDLSRTFGCHVTTLYKQLSALESFKYFHLTRKEGKYIVTRTSLIPEYIALEMDPHLFEGHNLTCSEKIIFSAILILQKRGKKALTRKALAGRTGFSLRQVSYSLKSLESTGLLETSTQEEEYVRNTQEGRIEDKRERRVYKVSQTIVSQLHCKIAPLKDIYRYPVINNGSFSKPSFQKSDFKSVWEFYQKHFQVHGFETVGSTLHYLKIKTKKMLSASKALEILQRVLSSPFLKLANKFGWQEAVVECYGRSQCLVTDSSRHIEKYSFHKPGLAWLLMNGEKILSGAYQKQAASHKQINWQEKWYDLVPKRTEKPNHNRKKTIPEKGKVLEEILASASLEEPEKRIRQMVLERVGAALYKTWLETSRFFESNGIVRILAPNRFLRDMIDQKIIMKISLGTRVEVSVA